MLDSEKLQTLAGDLKDKYHEAEPFPNICIDNFLPDDVAKKISEYFPSPKEMLSANKYQDYEKRIALDPEDDNFPKELEDIFNELNSYKIINFLEKVTGIHGLLPDPHYIGSGLIHTLPGGKLPLHVDFTEHKYLKLHRRINVLIYFNEDWKDEYGGGIELWSQDGVTKVVDIKPDYNRCVIFTVSEKSWHGHPDPIRCPQGVTRRSLNLYFYTKDNNPEQNNEISWTKHLKRKDSFQDTIIWPFVKFAYLITPPIVSKFVKKLLAVRNS